MCAIFQIGLETNGESRAVAGAITRKYGGEAIGQCFDVDLYPKSTAPVLGPDHKVALMRWGFPMEGSRKVIFNARAESLTEKSMFLRSLANRCLIPATSFYEFGQQKEKYRIRLEPDALFYMAALWKPYLYRGNKIYCFCIITTQPNVPIGRIHSRMPAIIPAEQAQNWLEGGMEALGLLKPLDRPMAIHPA